MVVSSISSPSPRILFCASADIATIVGCSLLATLLIYGDQRSLLSTQEGLLFHLLLVVVVVQTCLYYSDLYGARLRNDWLDLPLELMRALFIAGLTLSVTHYFFPAYLLEPRIILAQVVFSLLGLVVWRTSYQLLMNQGGLAENIVIFGRGELATDLARRATSCASGQYRILGFIGEDGVVAETQVRHADPLSSLDSIAASCGRRVDSVVVALDDQRGKLPTEALLRLRTQGIRVEEAATFYERVSGQLAIRFLRPSWLIFSDGFRQPRSLRRSKRLGELLLSSGALLLALPALFISAVLIWLDDGWPVLYKQERVGEGGREFQLYKLRTMRRDAEQHTGPVWAAKDGDSRVTRVGRFLRKTRLDELPQLFNVIRGEMSLVGPRPERPFFVARLRKLIPYYDQRHSLKPGITGWAQIKHSYSSTVEEAREKLQYDLYYVKNVSLLLDLGIILDTIKVMFSHRGAR